MGFVTASRTSFMRALSTAAAHSPPLAVVVDDAVDVDSIPLDAGRFFSGTHVQVVVRADDIVEGARNPLLAAADLAAAKDARRALLWAELRAFVDTHLPQTEREALMALVQRVTAMRALGVPVDEGAALVLAIAADWAERALALSAVVARAIEDAADIDAVAAVVVDYASLGDPPSVTAGEIAAALRGG